MREMWEFDEGEGTPAASPPGPLSNGEGEGTFPMREMWEFDKGEGTLRHPPQRCWGLLARTPTGFIYPSFSPKP